MCAEQISSFRGETSMWLPKWHNWRGTEVPFTPQLARLQLQYIWPLFLRHYLHQAGLEMYICDITTVFFIITLTWVNSPDEHESNRGWRGRKFKSFNLYFLVWGNGKVLECRAVAWKGEVHPKGTRWVRVPPSLTSQSPRVDSDPQGPSKMFFGRRLMRLVEKQRSANPHPPTRPKELVNVRKVWWRLKIGSSALVYMKVPPALWGGWSELGHRGTWQKCPRLVLISAKNP